MKAVAFKTMLLASLMFAAAPVLMAQEKEEHHHEGEDHEHTSPHGGTVKTAGAYHIELVRQENKVLVYLLDAGEKTIGNKGVTATGIFQFDDKTTSNETFAPAGDDHFEVTLKKTGEFTCIISLKVEGKTVSAKFDKEDVEHAEGHHEHGKTYVCPMHPDQVSDKPGKCSKCGMALVEKKEAKEEEEHDHHH